MQQVFRRQLLALGRLDGDEATIDRQCREFVRSVLAARWAMSTAGAELAIPGMLWCSATHMR